MSPRAPWFALCATGLALLLPAGDANAQQGAAPVSAAARKEAARRFTEGTRAFDAGDFTRAAVAFEAAYTLQPHEDPLWNAARAWHRAGELARAANLYARYLREAPATAPDRGGATAALRQLADKLARIEVHKAEGVDDVRVDNVPVDGPVVYLVPGTHALRAHTPQGDIVDRQVVGPGAEVSVLLSPPSSRPAVPEPPANPLPAPAPPPAPGLLSPPVSPAPPAGPSTTPAALPSFQGGSTVGSASSGWSPAIVLIELGVTAAVAGVTVWSGLDTLSTLHAFEAHPTQPTLDTGRTDEVRTNVLIGTSIGLAAVTGATALWLVDWGRHGREVKVRVGLGSAMLSGSF